MPVLLQEALLKWAIYALADAPQLDPEDKHDGLMENLINREDSREFVSGTHAFTLYSFCAAGLYSKF